MKDLVIGMLGSGISLFEVDFVGRDIQHFRSFVDGHCNVVAGAPVPESWMRDVAGYDGPYVIGTKPIGRSSHAMISRGNDPVFSDFISWVIKALFVAEARNITKETAQDHFPTTTMFGNDYKDMFINAISTVGNYGDIYGRGMQRCSGGGGEGGSPADQGEDDQNEYVAFCFSRLPANKPNTGESRMLTSYPFGKTEINDDDILLAAEPSINGTLKAINNRGFLRCGIVQSPTTVGFANYNETSERWTGMDADFCRGLAAALFAGHDDPPV